MNYSSFVASVDALRGSVEEGGLSENRIKSDVEKISSVARSDWLKRAVTAPTEDAPKRCNDITQCAVGLWNAVVAKYAGKSLSALSNAFLRQLCLELALCGITTDCCTEESKREMKRTIMMGIKVGKAWHDVSELGKAMDVLNATEVRIKGLIQTIVDEGNPDWCMADKMTLQHELLAVLCTMTEVLFSLGRNDEAIKLIEKASNLPILCGPVGEADEQFNIAIGKLCAVCYDCGLRLANEHRFDSATHWLGKSFDAGKRGKSIKRSVLAKILRLLAHCYSEIRTEEGDQKAVNALELAKGYHFHPSGLHLKLKIMARNKEASNEAIEPVLSDLLGYPDLSIELALIACRHLNAQNRFVLCEKAIERLLKKYSNSPQASRIHAERFEYTLQREKGEKRLEFALSFLKDEEIIRGLDAESRKRVHLLLWEQADKQQKKGDSNGVLSWQDVSLRFYALASHDTTEDDVVANIAKIQRNRASIMMSLGRLSEAKGAVGEAVKLDPDNPRTDYALFRVAVCEGNEASAIASVDRMAARIDSGMAVDGESSDERDPIATIHGLVCLAAQLAVEKDEPEVARKALLHVAGTTHNRPGKLLAYRCLVRMGLGRVETLMRKDSTSDAECVEEAVDGVLENIKNALLVLQDLSGRPLTDREMETSKRMELTSENEKTEFASESVQNEADWFMKICWNFGLETQSHPSRMKKLFNFCHEFLCLLIADNAVRTRQKTCLLMSCAAALEEVRTSGNKIDLASTLRFALVQVGRHKETCERMGTSTNPSVREEKEMLLRALYEFEAQAKIASLGGQHSTDSALTPQMAELEKLFEDIIAMRCATVKTLETVAWVCLEPPANHPGLSKRALKTAIKKLDAQMREGTDQDLHEVGARYSTFYRALIDLALKNKSGIDPASKEEAFSYVRDSLELAEGKLKEFYPEQECLWLTVTSWNIGARLYAADHLIPAEKWCSFAMRFLVHVKHYKSSYEAHMNDVFHEILSKKNSFVQKTRAMEIS